MDTQQKLSKLAEMAGQAGKLLFKRLTLAREVLDDRQWVATEHGDEFKAREALESSYFGDLCGAMTLGQLLEIIRMFPNENIWRENGYKLKRMHAEYQESKAVEAKESAEDKPKRDRVKQADVVKRDERIADLETDVRLLNQQASGQSEEIARLRDENQRLKLENAELKGIIKALELRITREERVAG